MAVVAYELDKEVFQLLNERAATLESWKGKASGISEYVASWGVERFWAMSRSQVERGGRRGNADQESEPEVSYFAWGVARQVLCKIVGADFGINKDMTTQAFQNQFEGLGSDRQVLLADLLIEIAEAIQFWTMRIDDANQSGQGV